jgi:hypothetical protein
MTTIHRHDVTCSVCGHQSETMVIGSTNQFGASDLDSRPPEMMRSTIHYWLHECLGCGCCAVDLTRLDPRVSDVVRRPAFQAMRAGLGELSESARKFRTATFIACELGDYAGAFLRALHEAWIHDDEGDSIRARAVRLDAVDFLHQVHRGGLRVYPEIGADDLVTVDLFRRAGEFDRAAAICLQVLLAPCSPEVRTVLEFQRTLCDRRDADCHTMDEVFGRK